MTTAYPIYNRQQIADVLSVEQLIEPMIEAYTAFSSGKGQSAIEVLHPTSQSDLHVKSAVLAGSDLFTVKTAGWSATNEAKGLATSSGMITVFDSQSCHPIALLQDDHLISDLRTAAAGAVACQLLAKADVQTVAVLGAGEQAFLQLMALCLVRAPIRVVLWSRNIEKADKLAQRITDSQSHLKVEVVTDVETAVRDNDVVICATAAKQPIVKGDWLMPGCHLLSVGADDASKCELDSTVLERANLIAVDSIDACQRYGNLFRGQRDGVDIQLLPLKELGSLLTASASARQVDSQVTVASLVGLGIQDLKAVEVLRRSLMF